MLTPQQAPKTHYVYYVTMCVQSKNSAISTINRVWRKVKPILYHLLPNKATQKFNRIKSNFKTYLWISNCCFTYDLMNCHCEAAKAQIGAIRPHRSDWHQSGYRNRLMS